MPTRFVFRDGNSERTLGSFHAAAAIYGQLKQYLHENQPEDESAQEMELWAILAGMNDKEQAFVRCRLDGRNCIEAAKMLGMSKSACCRMQQRIRRYLMTQMRAE